MNDFLKAAAERFSVRKFKDIPVEDEKINAILEAARLAPTACNYQPQKIYVIRDPEKLAALKAARSCVFNAPVVFLVGYDTERSAKGFISKDYDFGPTDGAIACTHMMFEAHALGLGSCWVGMFVEERVRSILNIPENIRLLDMLPVGYPEDGVEPLNLHSISRDISDMVEFI